ncbi:outer membrane beta-barrel protein [Methylocystis echinoides]|uniref:outer membrane protein n=1 Tax=Methylocystis echinoides TaxID=29468 RepID=UPI003442DA0F
MNRPTCLRLAALAFALAASGARAADLPNAKAPPPPPPPPVFSWQGGYIGGYAGALLGEGSFTLGNQTPLRGAAFVGGGALGYNYQWTETILLGLEADIGYRGVIRAGFTGNVYPSATNAGVLGTVRGRVGYAVAPRWLLFVSGGLAYGTNFLPNSVTSYAPLAYGRINNGPTVRPGWAAGAGFEYAWSDRISVKGEYLYAWLADTGVSYTTPVGVFGANVSSQGHIVRGGVNYHFAAGAPAAAPVLPQ